MEYKQKKKAPWGGVSLINHVTPVCQVRMVALKMMGDAGLTVEARCTPYFRGASFNRPSLTLTVVDIGNGRQ